MFDAKAKLSELIKQVEAGESITITRHGKPVATLAGIAKPRQKRKFGTGTGIKLMPGWDDPLPASTFEAYRGTFLDERPLAEQKRDRKRS